jgi:hypothetical protein
MIFGDAVGPRKGELALASGESQKPARRRCYLVREIFSEIHVFVGTTRGATSHATDQLTEFGTLYNMHPPIHDVALNTMETMTSPSFSLQPFS